MNEIILGDCLDLFKNIKDNSIDVVFADPPFNLSKKYIDYKDNLDDKKYLQWCEKWITESVRVVKQSGSIFIHNIPRWLTRYVQLLNEKCFFRHWISWDALGSPMGHSLQPSHYGILYYSKSDSPKFYKIRCPHKRCRHDKRLFKDYGGRKDLIHWFGPLVSDVWTDIHRIRHNKYRSKHPCQLPVHLIERIVLMSSDENDVVLDPFMGTGTTALAAKRLGRNYLGFEISDEYKQDALEKLNQENVKSKIGECWVSHFDYVGVITIRDNDCEKLLTNQYFDMPENKKELDCKTITLKHEFLEKLKT